MATHFVHVARSAADRDPCVAITTAESTVGNIEIVEKIVEKEALACCRPESLDQNFITRS